MPLRTSLVKHMRDGMSPAADPKTPSKVFCSSATATATLYSPVTPQVSHTPSTPAAAPSSSSSSIPRGLTGIGTPSTPYKWNFGPPASSCKTVGRFTLRLIYTPLSLSSLQLLIISPSLSLSMPTL